MSSGLVWSAALHAGLAGTDVANRIYQGLAILLTLTAVAATIVRLLSPTTPRTTPGALPADA